MTEAYDRYRKMPITQAHVEAEILRLLDLAEEKTSQLATYSEQAGIAEVNHKSAYAKVYLESDHSSQAMREQEATQRTHALFMKRRMAESSSRSCSESLKTTLAAVDTLRTISANIRGQT